MPCYYVWILNTNENVKTVKFYCLYRQNYLTFYCSPFWQHPVRTRRDTQTSSIKRCFIWYLDYTQSSEDTKKKRDKHWDTVWYSYLVSTTRPSGQSSNLETWQTSCERMEIITKTDCKLRETQVYFSHTLSSFHHRHWEKRKTLQKETSFLVRPLSMRLRCFTAPGKSKSSKSMYSRKNYALFLLRSSFARDPGELTKTFCIHIERTFFSKNHHFSYYSQPQLEIFPEKPCLCWKLRLPKDTSLLKS